VREIFINAIHELLKVQVTFFSIEDNQLLVRTCAPMDFGPSRRAKEKNDRYHFWDYDSDKLRHTLSINPEQVRKIVILEENFDPSEFVTWDTIKSPWFIKRDWGKYS